MRERQAKKIADSKSLDSLQMLENFPTSEDNIQHTEPSRDIAAQLFQTNPHYVQDAKKRERPRDVGDT